MAERTKNRKINFYKEKKWIMAYWFKRSRKAQFREDYLWDLWCKWWGNDFTDKSDARFQSLLPWLKEVKKTMTKDEIRAKRRSLADNKPMPEYIKKLASEKGYFVKKSSTRHHPLTVSGYAVFRNQKDRIPVYGKKFTLTAREVIDFLKAKENKKNDI